jgi:hypothetical protein
VAKVLGIATRLGARGDRVVVAYLFNSSEYLANLKLSRSFGLKLHKLLPVCCHHSPGDDYSNWLIRGRVIGLTIVWDGEALTGYKCCCGYVPKSHRVSGKFITLPIAPCPLFLAVFDHATVIASRHQSEFGQVNQLRLFE